MLPVLNKGAVERAIKFGLATGASAADIPDAVLKVVSRCEWVHWQWAALDGK